MEHRAGIKITILTKRYCMPNVDVLNYKWTTLIGQLVHVCVKKADIHQNLSYCRIFYSAILAHAFIKDIFV